MQHTDEKTKIFATVLGNVIKNLAIEKGVKSINNFANQYDIDDSNLNKIFKGKQNAKFVTLWKITQALGIKFSDFAKVLEQELGESFTLIDE